MLSLDLRIMGWMAPVFGGCHVKKVTIRFPAREPPPSSKKEKRNSHYPRLLQRAVLAPAGTC